MKRTHGLTTSPNTKKTYLAWHDIRRRCYDTEHREYKRYGLKGITIQESWKENPEAFCKYVLELPDFCMNKSLDRVDNKLGYTEGNLRWATDGEQTRNQGKQANNTSGVTGVTWNCYDGVSRAIAWWEADGKARCKCFSVKKLGLLPAFKLACEYREAMINKLNSEGYGYSVNHGK